ncbi:MAG TPA: GGDEF domain-containing protein [Tahibacter sp.]|uniref:GGDEF domain-containing protein n=1 Tax=Tahibacter sp. TaxID=2056211 RepID=UPI002B7D0258|nr:GGDEF domain-containing protein [Tahibacter sp.]HSX58858.1 GGDEF domain-containing protein [Tahibacter sp.]
MTAPSYLAVALCALAFVLALAFRRHRAAQLLAASTLAVAALSWPADGGVVAERARDAAILFLPWCWLLALLVPEPPLRSRRMLAYVIVVAVAAWLTTMTPAHVWDGLLDLLPLGGALRPARAALVLNLAAVAAALVHWLRSRRPLDAAIVLALLFAAGGWLQLAGLDLRSWLVAGAATLGVGVVYASWRLAFLDALTGLPNRRALDETLARLSGDYALAMVDVDHFKQFNDKHGHDAGDRVLAAVARSLAQTRAAQAFRFGGEEFCLLFRKPAVAHAACEEARVAIESLRVTLPRKPAAKPAKAGKASAKTPGRAATVQVTASIGVAPRGAARRAVDDVLKAADQCLYKAKDKGRNQVVALN